MNRHEYINEHTHIHTHTYTHEHILYLTYHMTTFPFLTSPDTLSHLHMLLLYSTPSFLIGLDLAHNHIEFDGLQLLVESLIHAENRALHALIIEGNPGYYPCPTHPRLPSPFSAFGSGSGTIAQGGSGGGEKEGGGKSDGGRKERMNKSSGTVSTTGAAGDTSISPLGEGGSLISGILHPGGEGNASSSSSAAIAGVGGESSSVHHANGHHTTTTAITANQRKNTSSQHHSPTQSSSSIHHGNKYRGDSHPPHGVSDLALAAESSSLSVLLRDLVTAKVIVVCHRTYILVTPCPYCIVIPTFFVNRFRPYPVLPFLFPFLTPSSLRRPFSPLRPFVALPHPFLTLPLPSLSFLPSFQAVLRLDYMPKGVCMLLKKWMARQRDETTRAEEMRLAQEQGLDLGLGQGTGPEREGGMGGRHPPVDVSPTTGGRGGVSGGQGLGSGQGKTRPVSKTTTTTATTTTAVKGSGGGVGSGSGSGVVRPGSGGRTQPSPSVPTARGRGVRGKEEGERPGGSSSSSTLSTNRPTSASGNRTGTRASIPPHNNGQVEAASSSSSHRHRQAGEAGGRSGSSNGVRSNHPTPDTYATEGSALSEGAAMELRSLGFVVNNHSVGPGQSQGRDQGNHIIDDDEDDEDLNGSTVIRDPWQSLAYEEVGGPPSNDYEQGLGTTHIL